MIHNIHQTRVLENNNWSLAGESLKGMISTRRSLNREDELADFAIQTLGVTMVRFNFSQAFAFRCHTCRDKSHSRPLFN
jgi:hypothetical protein